MKKENNRHESLQDYIGCAILNKWERNVFSVNFVSILGMRMCYGKLETKTVLLVQVKFSNILYSYPE